MMTRAVIAAALLAGAALLDPAAARADEAMRTKASAVTAGGQQALDADGGDTDTGDAAASAVDVAAAAAKARWQSELDRRIGQPPAPVINIYNTWTHERLAVEAGTPRAAETVPEELLHHFFRCHFTNQPTQLDPRLFAALVAAANHFEANRIDIVSGYRSPKYNLILRKKGREVARRSQHTVGHAVDFRLPGVSAARLHAWARRQRLGGVGYYSSSGFVHMDTGRIRYWTGR